MNIGLFLGHPAHYHMLKNTAHALTSDGHKVYFVIKQKDILENLLQEAGFEYTQIRKGRGDGAMGMVQSVLGMERGMCAFIRKNKIDLLIGSTLTFATRVIMHTPVVVLGEDDAAIVPRYAKLVYPWANTILHPVSCNAGKWEDKVVHYPGFQKLAYLHPKRFTADKDVVRRYSINPDKPYFIIRFAKLNAHHDSGVSGISTDIAQHLIDMLSPHGHIYITSERQLEPQFEQYRLQINPLDIHHVMAFATLYIGDSQSMAVEAAMLGVPSLRFNDFVGAKKIGVMEELEHVYGLTYGISSHEPETLYAKVAELLGSSIPDDGADRLALRDEWQNRRRRMLADKIDVTAFLTWFIEHYPQSASETKQADAEFWGRFK